MRFVSDNDETGYAAVPGVRPGRQRRSKALVDRLFAAAFELLETEDFGTLTIDDLCAGADATVGSFYARFASKQAFIAALQRLVLDETRASLVRDLAAGRVPRSDLETFTRWMCAGTVVWFRRYEGFIRASSRLTGTDPQAWEPLKELGAVKTRWCLPIYRSIAGAGAGKEFDRGVRAGLQVLHGTLNNIVLVDPGPLRLADKRTPEFLSDLVLASVRTGLARPPSSTRARTPRRVSR